MKKFLLPTLIAFPMLFLTGFASPISMSLFQDGFSVLDKLFLIGLGIALLGVIFLCIAFCKSVSKKEKPVESPFDAYLEENAQEDSIPEEAASYEETEPVCEDEESEILPEIPEEAPEEITDEPLVEEIPPTEDTFEEFSEENSEEISEEIPEETLENIAEDAPEEIPEDIVEDMPEEIDEVIPEKDIEEIIYPKLILTHVHTNDFVILPLYPETTVGRKTDNDLVLSDVTISGLHCKILNENGLIYVVDENSTNGTFVNDERISEKAQLHHGDKLTLGKQEFNISVNE